MNLLHKSEKNILMAINVVVASCFGGMVTVLDVALYILDNIRYIISHKVPLAHLIEGELVKSMINISNTFTMYIFTYDSSSWFYRSL